MADTLPLMGRVGAKRRGGVIATNSEYAAVTPTRSFAATSPIKGEVKTTNYAFDTSAACSAPDTFGVTLVLDLKTIGWAYCSSGMT